MTVEVNKKVRIVLSKEELLAVMQEHFGVHVPENADHVEFSLFDGKRNVPIPSWMEFQAVWLEKG